jgi:hypothetical protein
MENHHPPISPAPLDQVVTARGCKISKHQSAAAKAHCRVLENANKFATSEIAQVNVRPAADNECSAD